MSSSQWQPQIIPARLAFLGIYNPTLGLTDETFPEQLVLWYSRSANEARKTSGRSDGDDEKGAQDAAREERNESLRQIGLAQGIVDFARNFSDGQPVDSVDTEKSRIILHELEPGWWLLASIDLTKLPSLTSSESGRPSAAHETSNPVIEYSAREVSPPALLIQQVLQAHHVFSLHHGPSLDELYVRLSRHKFCALLERFWTRFARSWDVLLHGNPAADVFDGVKLSSGGELGMGVGEENWGSGERDVLEDLTRRTEGLVDMVISRFGEPAPSTPTPTHQEDGLSWLGTGCSPEAADGVIFGGVGAITRPSLRNVSLWVRQIYTYGEHAYGVRDNPSRERRKRRRRKLPEPELELDNATADSPLRKAASDVSAKDWGSATPDTRPAAAEERPAYSKSFAGSHASHDRPQIPPPIVAAVENSLDKATQKADFDAARTPKPVDDPGTTLGIPDQYMKYLTFGLSTLAKPAAPKQSDTRRASTSSSVTIKPRLTASDAERPLIEEASEREGPLVLSEVDPIPDGDTRQAKIVRQRMQEEQGYYVVGLKGDLDSIRDETDTGEEGTALEDPEGSRMLLRTLYVELTPEKIRSDRDEVDDDTGLERLESPEFEPNASNETAKNFRRLRVVVYVRRPFVYCLLFENRAPSLSMAQFYKTLHQSLVPVHKPLLSSTSPDKIAHRIEESQAVASASDSASGRSELKASNHSGPESPIYDLCYDPKCLTIHTSIPNIPEPGTPAAEGIKVLGGGTKTQISSWTRIEALNVHSQILTTLAATQHNIQEQERTSKTSRGWWVVWLKLLPSGIASDEPAISPIASMTSPPGRITPSNHPSSVSDATLLGPPSTTPTWQKGPPSLNRIAFLVRKAAEGTAASSRSTSASVAATASSRAMSSMWNVLSLRPSALSDDNTGGAGAGWGPAALAGGIGFDARKYAEGLLSLNR